MHKRMQEVQVRHNIREKALLDFTFKSFDITNQEQLKTLTLYLNHFELSANKKYLLQGMTYAYAASWCLSWFNTLYIPLVDYPEWILRYCLLKVLLVSQLSSTNFDDQLMEMKTIYNWCLKNGEEHYNPVIDNDKKLEHPEIVRLIKLLAPFCEVEFMVAWTNVETQPKKYNNGWANTFYSSASFLYSSVTLPYSLATKGLSALNPSQEAIRVKALKTSVETHAFKLDTITSSQQAMKYFAFDPSFRSILIQSISEYAVTVGKEYKDAILEYGTNELKLS